MTATENHVESHHDEHHDHPSDASYIGIALFLGFLTALEILLFVFEGWIEDNLGISWVKIGLIVLMVIKFFIVGAYFMHLKFDNSILWKLFAAGLILAVGVYWIMLSAFEFSFWNDGYEDSGFWEGQVEFEQRVEDS